MAALRLLMFTDAKENLRIIGYFRGCGFVLGLAESADVTILMGKTLDSAVMTTRAEKYH
jgi:hypothetical protein